MKNALIIMAISVMLAGCGRDAAKTYSWEGYRSWRKMTPEPLEYPVPGHGKALRVIYVNAIAAAARWETRDGRRRLVVPEGGIVVKEQFADRAALAADTVTMFTVMVKDSSHPLAHDGWIYFMTPSTASAEPLRSQMCLGCHEAANDRHIYFDRNEEELFRDYLFIRL